MKRDGKTFWRGFSLPFSGLLGRKRSGIAVPQTRPEEADAKKLAEDWEKVGKDLFGPDGWQRS